jgi:23S rRNA G2069 N7-methylase RlmK/C1962 C5-methylase RlmI
MEGNISLFFIMSKYEEVESADFKGLLLRKVDTERVSIACWNSESQAEEFLCNTIHQEQYFKVVTLNVNQLRDYIHRIQIDPKNIVLESF